MGIVIFCLQHNVHYVHHKYLLKIVSSIRCYASAKGLTTLPEDEESLITLNILIFETTAILLREMTLIQLIKMFYRQS